MLLRRKIDYVLIILAAIFLGFLVQTNSYLIKPGDVEDLGCLIEIEGHRRDEPGRFYMLTVSQHPANLWNFLYGYMHPAYDVRSLTQTIPSDMTREEYNDLMQCWMQDSKDLAGVIAFRRAGYEVPITSEGVEVVELLPKSPAEGLLRPGDIITAIEGKEVYLAEEVVAHIQQKKIGEKVKIGFRQEGEKKETEIPTVSHIDEPHLGALRLYVRTLNWEPLFPMKIEIETGPVIGPSAGMMFVLEILDRLLPENLTGGYRIGGTGTISLDEKVGAIGGIRQKVITAEKAGLDYFLVPAENYEEALQAASNIKVVSVNNLEEALSFLKTLNAPSKEVEQMQKPQALSFLFLSRVTSSFL